MSTRQSRDDQLNHVKPSRSRRLVAATLAAAVVGLAFASSTALAASTHPFKEEWSVGSGCTPRDLATDASGNVYVVCQAVGTNGLAGAIRKFSPTGAPEPFTAPAAYVNGNEITEDPGSNAEGTHRFGPGALIDVNKSSARPGFIYVSGNGQGSNNIDIFAPSGEYVTSIPGEFFTGEAGGVGLDQNGFIYTVWEGCCGRAHISIYDPANFHEVQRLVPFKGSFGENAYHGPCCVRVRPDSAGGAWVTWGGTFGDGSEWFSKYEASAFGTNLNAGEKDPSTVVSSFSPFLAEAFESCPETQPLNTPEVPGFACSLKGRSFDVNLANNDVYADEGSKIVPYSPGLSGDPVHQDGPAFGEGKLVSSKGIDIAPSGDVVASLPSNKVVVFSKGGTLPTVTSKEAAFSDIGHTTATVRGIIDPSGAGEITACKVKFGETTAYTGGGSPVTCTELMPYLEPSPKEVSASLTGLTVGKTYHFRFEATNANGSNFGGDRTFEAKAVLQLKTKPATEVGRNTATLQGELDTDALPNTEYWFEYGPTASYGLKTLNSEGKGIPISGSAGELKQTPFALAHLQAGHTYHYRLVAKNGLGTTKGKDLTVRTASPPEISGVGADHVTDTSARIHARINPVGYATTYVLEYGPTTEYGQTLPPSPEDELGSGNSPVEVSLQLNGLPPETTIHYRVGPPTNGARRRPKTRPSTSSRRTARMRTCARRPAPAICRTAVPTSWSRPDTRAPSS